jgi:putative ABC transport system permease protein
MAARTLRTAPWRRAPLLLARQPVVAAAIVLAAAVLGVAASSAPLFLSTIGSGSLRTTAAIRCAEQSMPSVGISVGSNLTNFSAAQNRAIGRRVAAAYRAENLPAPFNVVWAQAWLSAQTLSGPVDFVPAYAFSWPGALDHVQKLTSAGGKGAWLNDLTARQLDLRAGMMLRLGDQPPIRIAGTYRRLDDPNDPAFQLAHPWCSWHNLIVPDVATDKPPTFVIVDDPDYVIGASTAPRSAWYSPVNVQHLTLTQATAAADRGLRAGHRVAGEEHGELGGRIVADKLFVMMTDRSRHIERGMAGAIVPIAAGGIVVALLLVGGAGWFWALRRRGEIDVLVSRGIGPAALGAKAVLETLPWVLAGSAAGFGLTTLLVLELGPVPALAGGAVLQALAELGMVALAGVVLIGGIGAAAGRERMSLARWRTVRRLRFVPWELGLFAGALAVYASAHGRGITVDDQATVQLGPAVLAFPLLAFAGALILLTRLLRQMLPALRRIGRRRGLPVFLAFTRMASSPAVALGVVVGVALPCGMLVYASGLERSLHTSIEAKYETNVGAPHVFSTVSNAGQTLALHGTGTQVSVIEQEPVADNGEVVRVLGVDPAGFREFAYLTGKQRRQLAALAEPGHAGAVPALVVNPDRAGRIRAVAIKGARLQLHVAATAEAFPGLRNSYQPMIVVNRAALADLPTGIGRTEQVWTSAADYPAAVDVLVREQVGVLYELSPDVVIGNTGLQPVTWVLSYLRALALLVALVALAGLVFALAARARRTALAYVLCRRMGVSGTTQLASLVAELAAVVGTGWLLGTALAEGGIGIVYRLLDTYPQFPPKPWFVFDAVVVAGLAAAAFVVILAAAGFAHLVAERSRPADVVRAL